MGADVISMLRLYDWYPSGLLEINQDKRTERWDWIMAKDPGASTVSGSSTPSVHCFWAKGYGASVAKDDMLFKADIVKSLNFRSFRSILLQVSELCTTKSPGPVEVRGLIRRHWNDLCEPSLDNLRSKVKSKKKRLRAMNQAADPSTANGPGAAGNEVEARVAEVAQPGVQLAVPGMAPPPQASI